jgi:hypothetical protein
MLMRQRSSSSSNNSQSGEDGYEASRDGSSCDADDRWDEGTVLTTDQGSIKIMFDDDTMLEPEPSLDAAWSNDFEQVRGNYGADDRQQAHAQTPQGNEQAYATNGWDESPEREEYPNTEFQETPRRSDRHEETLKTAAFKPAIAFAVSSDDVLSNTTIARALDEYNATGSIAPELLQEMEKHSVDFDRLSQNGGSDAMMIQNLLDSIANERALKCTTPSPEEPSRSNSQYDIPAVTPDTPPDAKNLMGTAVVFGRDGDRYDDYDRSNEMIMRKASIGGFDGTPEVLVQDQDGDFAAQIAKANEAWERKQRGEEFSPDPEAGFRPPTPPPKDIGYTPRSSVGPSSKSVSPNLLMEGLRISTAGEIDLSSIQAAGDSAKNSAIGSTQPSRAPSQAPSPTLAPPLPNHAPPPPPPGALPFGMPEVPQLPAPISTPLPGSSGHSSWAEEVAKNAKAKRGAIEV